MVHHNNSPMMVYPISRHTLLLGKLVQSWLSAGRSRACFWAQGIAFNKGTDQKRIMVIVLYSVSMCLINNYSTRMLFNMVLICCLLTVYWMFRLMLKDCVPKWTNWAILNSGASSLMGPLPNHPNHPKCAPQGQDMARSTGWWFQLLWKIVSWGYSQYMESHKKCSKPPTSQWFWGTDIFRKIQKKNQK